MVEALWGLETIGIVDDVWDVAPLTNSCHLHNNIIITITIATMHLLGDWIFKLVHLELWINSNTNAVTYLLQSVNAPWSKAWGGGHNCSYVFWPQFLHSPLQLCQVCPQFSSCLQCVLNYLWSETWIERMPDGYTEGDWHMGTRTSKKMTIKRLSDWNWLANWDQQTIIHIYILHLLFENSPLEKFPSNYSTPCST